MWRAKEITAEDAALYSARARATGLGTTVHCAYLVNLGCGPGELRQRSIAAFTDELSRCVRIGAPFLVVHPGSNPDSKAGIRLIAEALDETFRAVPKGMVLLETAAGQGNAIGRTFEELREIRDRSRHPDRIGVCVDTCHVFAAGYDLSTDRGYDETFDRFDEVLGVHQIKAFHLNDSVKPLGCRVDRHAHVCKGEIGTLCFRRLVNDARFAKVPAFLEIPPEGNRACLRRLKRLRASPSVNARTGKPRVATRTHPD